MPAAAIIGAAAIGGGASLIASGKNSKAINTATDAQLTATRESNALAREVRDENRGILSPYVQQGYSATGALGGLLGLGGGPSNAVGALGDPMRTLGADQVTTTGAASPYQAAFQNYLNSTGYGFRMGEGQKALNASFAARGLGNSGASAKAAMNYGQNIASDEFGRYLGYLGQQQQVGLSAGNALAGVGTNFANTVSANNNNAASAIGNGALAGAANTNALYGNLAGIAGQAAGYFSSYGGGLGSWGGGNRNAYGVSSSGGGIY